jgi:hypothetical protein
MLEYHRKPGKVTPILIKDIIFALPEHIKTRLEHHGSIHVKLAVRAGVGRRKVNMISSEK